MDEQELRTNNTRSTSTPASMPLSTISSAKAFVFVYTVAGRPK